MKLYNIIVLLFFIPNLINSQLFNNRIDKNFDIDFGLANTKFYDFENWGLELEFRISTEKTCNRLSLGVFMEYYNSFNTEKRDISKWVGFAPEKYTLQNYKFGFSSQYSLKSFGRIKVDGRIKVGLLHSFIQEIDLEPYEDLDETRTTRTLIEDNSFFISPGIGINYNFIPARIGGAIFLYLRIHQNIIVGNSNISKSKNNNNFSTSLGMTISLFECNK
jgi:hypothetical protein